MSTFTLCARPPEPYARARANQSPEVSPARKCPLALTGSQGQINRFVRVQLFGDCEPLSARNYSTRAQASLKYLFAA